MSVSVPRHLRPSLDSSSLGDARVSVERRFGSSADRGNVINKSTKRRMSDSDAQPSRKKCHLMETRMDSMLKIPVISLRSRIVLKQKTAKPTVPSIVENFKNAGRSRIATTRGKKSVRKRNRFLVTKRNVRKIITRPKLEHLLKYRKNEHRSKDKLHYLRVFATKSEEEDQGNCCQHPTATIASIQLTDSQDQGNCCQHPTATIPFIQLTDSPANYLFNANSMMYADEEEGFLSTSEIEQLNLDLGDTIMSDSFLNDINGEDSENVSSKSQNNIFFDDRK